MENQPYNSEEPRGHDPRPEKEGSVARELIGLRDAIDHLNEVVALHEKRLTVSLRESTPRDETEGEKDTNCQSELACTIQNSRDKIRNIAGRIQEITERIEL